MQVEIIEVMQTQVDAVRSMAPVARHVPPLSFRPPLDVIAGEDCVILEVVLPGIHRDDVTVERAGDTLVISGIRRDEHGARGCSYHHTETPRGPFHRIIPLPLPLAGEPRVELDRGVLRVHVAIVWVEPGDPREQSNNHDSNLEKA